MRILIVVQSMSQINFFLSVATYVQSLGHSVFFLCKGLHKVKAINKAGFFTYENISEGNFDLVLFWNGTKTKEKEFFEESGAKCWYFENGYWQEDTLQVNLGGVNNEADYAKLSLHDKLQFSYPQKQIHKNGHFETFDLKASLFWYFYGKIKTINSIETIKSFSLQFSSLKQKRAALRFKKLPYTKQPKKPFIFFPLQVNSDTQLKFNSLYTSISEVVNFIQEKIPHKYNLVLKTHPQEFEKNKFILKNNTKLVEKIDLDQAVIDADFVITINSSVGLQALEKHKKVLHLGDSFYDNFPGVVKCNLYEDDFVKKMNELSTLQVDWHIVDVLVSNFRHNIFINGNWRRPNKKMVENIASRILA